MNTLVTEIRDRHNRLMKAPASNSALPAALQQRVHLFSVGGGNDSQSQSVTQDLTQDYLGAATVYQSYVWVRKAVGKVADAFASLPVGVVDGNGKPQPNHDIALLLARGNDQASPALLWEQYAISMMLAGENFFEIVKDGRGRPAELWQRRADAVTLRMDGSPERRIYPRVGEYEYAPEFIGASGDKVLLSPEEMVHDKFHNPLNIWRGLAPIAAVREGIVIDLFARAWRRSFLKRGARPDYALIAPQGITKTEKDELEATLIQKFAGSENWHRPIVLEEGITDIKTFSFPPRDVEWLQQQEFSRDEVGAIFGVPDEIMGYGKDTYENFQTALEVFWTLTVRPLAQHRDNVLTHYFTHVLPLLKPGEKVQSDYSGVGVLQDDLAPRVQVAAQLWQMGVPFADINERLNLGFGNVGTIDPMKTAKEGGDDQPPFAWSGQAIHKRASVMPGADGNDRQRAKLERLHGDKIAVALRKILRLVVPTGTSPETITPEVAVERYKANETILRDALVEMLLDAGVDLGARIGLAQIEWVMGTGKAAIGINWDLVNQEVLDWLLGTASAPGYADILTQAVGETSALQIRQHVSEWVSNGLPLRVLVDSLRRSAFSEQRAQLIAVTEVTRAYAEGNRAAWRASGIIARMGWRTSADELVCPICRPLNGRVTDVSADGWRNTDDVAVFPPAHPRCRCWVTPVVS